MALGVKTDRPIYTQLQDHIKLCIISGKYLPGDKLPSVRDLRKKLLSTQIQCKSTRRAGAPWNGIYPENQRTFYYGGYSDD